MLNSRSQAACPEFNRLSPKQQIITVKNNHFTQIASVILLTVHTHIDCTRLHKFIRHSFQGDEYVPADLWKDTPFLSIIHCKWSRMHTMLQNIAMSAIMRSLNFMGEDSKINAGTWGGCVMSAVGEKRRWPKCRKQTVFPMWPSNCHQVP